LADKFTELLRKLVRVPKHEIDAQEKKYQEDREGRPPDVAKRGEIVPRPRKKAG
jgi:hypothetical protein